MDRGHLQNSDLNRSHEPVGIPLNRPPGTFSPTVGEGRDEGVRFMESLLSLLRTHWDHEPLRLTEARSGPRVCDPQPARFVENTVSACKKSRPMAGFLLQSTCREFRESDRTNKFYRPRSPPRPRPRIPHFRLRERGRRRQVRPIPVDRRCSSLQPKPVAAHLLTFPLSPLRPRQARRTVLLWLRLRRLVEFHDSDACRHIYPLKYPPWLCQRAFALRAAVEPWTPFPNRPWPLGCYPSPSESTRSNRRGRGSRVPADLTVR